MTEQKEKIYLMTYYDEDVFGGTTMVSHGITEHTLKNVVLPQETLSYYINNMQAQLDETTSDYFIQ